MAQHRYPDAVELMVRRNRNFPSPASYLLAARAFDHAGKPAEAATMYAEFVRVARAKITLPENANVQLISYYCEHAHEPQEALRIARLEIAVRHDVWTLDAYAWALYANASTMRPTGRLIRPLRLEHATRCFSITREKSRRPGRRPTQIATFSSLSTLIHFGSGR